MNTVSRWLVAALILLLGGTIAVGTWFYRAEQVHMRQRAEAELEAVAGLKVKEIADWRQGQLGEGRELMASMFFGQGVGRWLAGPQTAPAEEIQSRFRGLRDHYHYTDIVLTDPEGQARLSLSGRLNRLDAVESRSLAVALRDRTPVLTDLYTGEDRQPHLSTITPVFSSAESPAQPVGAVILKLDVEQFLYPLIQSWPTPSRTAETLLVRRDGDSVLFLNELRHQTNTALKLRLPLTKTDVPAVKAVLGQRGVVHGTDYRGVEVVSVLKAIPGSPWFMVAKMDAAEVFAAWRTRAILILTLAIGLVMVAAAVALVVWQNNAKAHYRALYHTEAARRQAEERHRITLRSIGDAVIASDAEGKVELLNPVAEKLTGYREAEAIGQPLEQVFRIVNEESRATVENPVRRVMREGIIVGLANHTLLISRDGHEYPIADAGAPIRDPAGNITGAVLVFRDITEHKAHEREIERWTRLYAALSQINQAIVHVKTDEELAQEVSRVTVEFGGFPLAWVGRHDAQTRAVTPLGCAGGPLEVVRNFRHSSSESGEARCLCAPVILQNRCRVANAISEVPEMQTWVSAMAPTGIRAAAVFPVRVGGAVWGVFGVYASEPGVFQDKEIALLEEAAMDIGYGIENLENEARRRRADVALRASEENYRLLFNNMIDGFALHEIICDKDGIPVDYRFLMVNPAFERLTGLSPSKTIGRRVLDLMPGIEDFWIKTYGEVALTGKPTSFERYSASLDRWYKVEAFCPKHGFFGAVFADVTAQKKAIDTLKASESWFRSLIEGAPEAAFVQCDGIFRYVNQAMVKLMGATRAEDLLGMPFTERIAPEYHDAIRERIRAQLETGAAAPPVEQVYLRLDGTQVHVETTAVAIRFREQDGHMVFVRDITARREAEAERSKLEEQLRQAQKMESVGRLAGGVAHDFNNLLMGIMNYAELCRDGLPADHPVRPWLDEITTDAQRSAGITRQLLAFARKQTIAPVPLDLNDHVAGMLKLMRRLIGEDIDLTWRPGAQDARVKMDPSQVDQILANLAVNARDAITGVGKITVETADAVFDADYCAEHRGTIPGTYVMLAVSDSGCGMDAETLAHIFEPFFTTKPAGQGTGLGLATVYGIVKQNEGFVNVYSEPGEGTTFRIYLRQYTEDRVQEKAEHAPAELPRGTETVLLVEDERSVRVTTALFLQSLGYTVLSAANPDEALRQAAEHRDPPHLLITDIVMPGMSGRDLAARLSETNRCMKCLYISGYTANVIAHRGILDEGVQFLAKPFTREDIARKVRQVLGDQRRDTTSG